MLAAVERCARASSPLNGTAALTELRRLAFVLQEHASLRFRALLKTDEPCLAVYFADGWGATLQSSVEAKVGSYTVRRRGRLRNEFLLQRASVKVLRNTGQVEMAMLVGEPIGMGHGRSCWHIFSAACDFMPLPRIIGHTGICISAHVLDGGVFGPLHRTLSARSKLLYEQEDIDFGPLAQELAAKDWVVGFRCIDHSCSNGLRWGLAPFFINFEKDDVHIAVAACRNGAAGLHAKVSEFVLMSSPMAASMDSYIFLTPYSFYTVSVFFVLSQKQFTHPIIPLVGAPSLVPTIGVTCYSKHWRNFHLAARLRSCSHLAIFILARRVCVVPFVSVAFVLYRSFQFILDVPFQVSLCCTV
jgi:hypothetical protein